MTNPSDGEKSIIGASVARKRSVNTFWGIFGGVIGGFSVLGALVVGAYSAGFKANENVVSSVYDTPVIEVAREEASVLSDTYAVTVFPTPVDDTLYEPDVVETPGVAIVESTPESISEAIIPTAIILKPTADPVVLNKQETDLEAKVVEDTPLVNTQSNPEINKDEPGDNGLDSIVGWSQELAYAVDPSFVNEISYGISDITLVQEAISAVHEYYPQFKSFSKGTVVPVNSLIASNIGLSGINWSDLPLEPVCYNGGWGLFRSTAEYEAPYDGAYWHIVDPDDYDMILMHEVSELNYAEANTGRQAGLNYFMGIPFDYGWTTTTNYSDHPEYPESFRLDVDIRSAKNVYVLYHAGWGIKDYEGKEFGMVSLEFDNGMSLNTPITLGYNIRDWCRNNPIAVNTISAPNVYDVASGVMSDGRIGGLDMLVIEIPDGYSGSVLRSVIVYDQSIEKIGSPNPCIHVLGMTVENG